MSQPNNPFPADDSQEIYAPPNESPETATLCPRCGKEMEPGELYSNAVIAWREATESKLKRFITGGNPIGKTKSGLGCRYTAYHCESCKIFTLVE